MFTRNFSAFVCALAYAFVLTACGDLGMVLPSQGSYQVNAQVDGDYTLDTYSVVTKNSRIRPYFVNSVVNDPDVRGITVFVQDYSGTIVSRKVQYRLSGDARTKADEPEPPAETPQETAGTGAPAAAVPDKAPLEGAPEDETALPGTTEAPAGTGPPADGQVSSGETRTEPSGPVFDDPAAGTAAEYPDETPAAISGKTGIGTADDDARSVAGAAPGDSGTGTRAADPADTAAAGKDAANTGAVDRGSTDAVNTGVANTGAANTDSVGKDAAGAVNTGVANTDAVGKDAAGAANTGAAGATAAGKGSTGVANTDTANTDAVGKDAAGAVNTGVAGAAAAGRGSTGVANTDTANTDAVGKDAAGAVNTGAAGAAAAGKGSTGVANTDSAGKGASGTVNTDAVGTDAGDSGSAGADTVEVKTAVPAPQTLEPSGQPSLYPLPADETILVRQLDQYLPPFSIIENIDIGRYNLVFQVMGEKEALYRTYKPIYFIGDAAFTLGDIQSFLPAAVTGGRLIPPGINVMLETKTSADPRLDPYVIWHSGKKILAQGRLSAGANSLLWKTPEQTGFNSIRVEVFPLLAGDRMPGNMIGKIKELSLPVSLKSEGIQQFRDPSGEFVNWYQLWGTLDDARAPNSADRRLVSVHGQAARWIPFGGMYGLLVGQEDRYILPGSPFKVSAGEQGTGRILLHLAALSEGVLLNIGFAGEAISPRAGTRETADSPVAELDLSLAGNALVLRIASDGTFQEESLELNGDESRGFVTVAVEFTLAPDRLDAELRLENPAGTTGPLSIPLAVPSGGAGAVCLGGVAWSAPGRSAQGPATDEAGNYNGTMALNELALSYARRSIPREEEESESGIPETVLAGEDNPGAEPESPSLNAR